ncbi:helix-turn-helix domain-containing protein [Leptospira terpstrae]|uniref:AraC family transcriptional regulator n=1 Tax=Leptospira terpstrae TaxID=293075 RepID=UPI003D01CEC3
MNLIPFAGFVVALLLAVSHGIETFQQMGESKNGHSPEMPAQKLLGVNFYFRSFYRFTSTFLFLSLAILQFHIYGELTREINSFPFLFGIHIPFLLLIGPLSYIYFEEMSGGEIYKIRSYHFLPSILSLIFVYLLRPKNFELPLLHSQIPIENLFYHTIIESLLSIGVVSIFIYTVSIMIRVFRWKFDFKKSIESSFLPFLFLLIYSLSVVVLFVLSQIVFMQLFLLACVGLTSLLVLILLLKINGKELIPNFKKETRSVRYKESRVNGINVNQVLQRLDDLMNLDHLYLNEDLSLPILSKHLGLHTHQLSEILNSMLGCTFRNYINQFRLQEAARLLLEKPDMTILSVIYASGFNSKSSFHKLFQERFGISPQNYRSKID